MHLLHLEDSAHDGELIEELVRRQWPECRFERVVKRADFEAALARGGFRLILSDYTLPDFDGLSALRLARHHCPEKPFIFLSGTIGEERAIEALKSGATDYVFKDRPNRIVPAIRQALVLGDATEQRRRAELRLVEQAVLLDRARDAICVTDLAHRITYWNASAERLFGWSPTEALGRDLRKLLFPQPAGYDEASWRLRADGEWQGELRPQRRAGGILVIESRWTLVAVGGGEPQHVLLINTDVTEKRRLETQFLRTQRMDSIGTLAGGIAHDLNNVLNPILIGAGLLRNEELSARAREVAASIEAGARHGAALIKQLLAFARGADGLHLELQPARLIAGLGPLLQPILPRNLLFSTQGDDTLWHVSGDATQLNQVLINLCMNARDAMPAGGTLDVSGANLTMDEALAHTLLDGKPGPYVCISVSDTGTGIPAEHLEKIFDPFFTTKPLGKGTGLGLSIVRGIIKGHGGCLQVESQVGRGTTFRVYLPAQLRPLDPPTINDTRPGSPRPREGILLIDDDHAVRNILQLLLESAGYRVFPAEGGAAGIAEFERHGDQIEVVITDMMMPGMTGPEAITALRKIRPGLKVIAISGLMEENSHYVRRLAGPPIECLSKPISAAELFAAIERTVKCPG